jgi:hypothetical protein
MEPRTWDGPSVERSVLARMKRLDPQLRVTFSPYALDPMTCTPIEQSGILDPYTGEYNTGLVEDPAFYLWRKDECSSHHVFVKAFPRFTDREVLALERDVARFNRPQDIMRIFHERDTARREKALANKRELQNDKIAANARRIDDLVLGGKTSRRGGRSYGYSGQGSKGSPGDVEMDPREGGWELPEQE